MKRLTGAFLKWCHSPVGEKWRAFETKRLFWSIFGARNGEVLKCFCTSIFHFPFKITWKYLRLMPPNSSIFWLFGVFLRKFTQATEKGCYHRTQGNNLNQLMDSKLKSRKWKRETIGAQTKSNLLNFQLKLCYQSCIWKGIVWKWRVNAPFLEEGLHNFLNVAKKRTWWVSRQFGLYRKITK